jgi:predicted nucleotidyltransferase component of viral defense system
MLSFDSLKEQARIRGMPATKMRGVLREYLQVLILKAIYGGKLAQQLYFTGGTYLRMVHNLKRFSEDLDFNAKSISVKTFESSVKGLKVELGRVNVMCNVEFDHWNSLMVAKIIFPDIEDRYAIESKHKKKKGITIKIEAYRPKWKLTGETEVISGYGETYPCLCTDRTTLFADKIDAFLKKGMARHLYDIIFMFTQRFGVNRSVAGKLGICGDPLEALASYVQSCPKRDLRKKAEALRPFLFEEGEADLVANAQLIIPKLIEKYRT